MAEESIPSIEEQRKTAKLYLSKPLIKGDTWYLVHYRWFRNFKRFVGLEGNDSTNVGSDHPGPIDNGPLYDEFDHTKIKDNLNDEIDYVLVPSELWTILVQWYGLMPDNQPIPRRVVEFGVFTKHCKVEVYLVELKLCRDFDFTNIVIKKFSKSDTVETIEHVMRRLFNIPDQQSVEIIAVFGQSTFEKLHPEYTIQDEGLFVHQTLVIKALDQETCVLNTRKCPLLESDIALPKPVSSDLSCKSNSNDLIITDLREADTWSSVVNVSEASIVNMSVAGPSTNIKATRFSYENPLTSSKSGNNVHPGLCGLCNLGNTCFMNSVLQCMSNCPPITLYFLNNQYVDDINKTNPLGMRGEIASSFAELIKVMWSGKQSYTIPHNFKLQVGKFAPQFSGYQQHDSQELLTFLLDGLHEDLNRVKNKPYIIKKISDGRNDKECAKEAWESYLKRNDSIIVDVFHGLLKSTVVCPQCTTVSVTFDPFCYLSLPLPVKRDRFLDVTYLAYDFNTPPTKFRITVPKKGMIQDITTSLTSLNSVKPEYMLVAEVSRNHFHKFFCSSDSIDNIDDKDELFVYEIPYLPDQYNAVPVCLWEFRTGIPFNIGQLFGIPIIVCVPKVNCTYDYLYDTILRHLGRFIHEINNKEELSSIFVDEVLESDDVFGKNSSNAFREKHHAVSESKNYLFNMFVVNSSTTTEISMLHIDNNFLYIPNILGRQYVALQWLPSIKKQIFCESSFDIRIDNSMEMRRSIQKMLLTDCLELYTTCEKLGIDDAWYCPECKQHQRATKKFDLWNLPNILIIHLKRFSFNRYRRDKIDTDVDFPLYGLSMDKYVVNPDQTSTLFDLIGVCNHYGGLGGGHYTAYCKNRSSNRWYCFDDKSVTAIGEASVVSNAAYVLFYMKRSL